MTNDPPLRAVPPAAARCFLRNLHALHDRCAPGKVVDPTAGH